MTDRKQSVHHICVHNGDQIMDKSAPSPHDVTPFFRNIDLPTASGRQRVVNFPNPAHPSRPLKRGAEAQVFYCDPNAPAERSPQNETMSSSAIFCRKGKDFFHLGSGTYQPDDGPYQFIQQEEAWATNVPMKCSGSCMADTYLKNSAPQDPATRRSR